MKKLIDIARIKPGYPFRGRLTKAPSGGVSVIQMKDVTDTFWIDLDESLRIGLHDVKERYLLAPKDIVFRSRGQTNTCALVPDFAGMLVVSAPMFQIRVTSDCVLPEYVCWYINQPVAQSHFDRHASGTAGRMISKDALEDLPINIPSLDNQRMIVEMALLCEHELQLMGLLAEKKKMLVSEILIQQTKV